MRPPTRDRLPITDDIFQLTSAITDELASLRPHEATYLGIAGFDDRWDDFTAEGSAQLADALSGMKARVSAITDTKTPWESLAARVVLDYLDDGLDDLAHGEHLLELNTVDSPLCDIRDVFDLMDTDTSQGWENIAARLDGLPEALRGYRARLNEGRRRGVTVARRQALASARDARTHAGPDSSLHGLLAAFDRAAITDDGLRSRLEETIPLACRAYGRLADYLEQVYARDAQPKDAVGEERYVRRARGFLGTEIDPGETYAWGWSEVERLRDEMKRVAAEIDPGGDLRTVIELLQTDPGRAAPDQEAFLSLMQRRQEEALAQLDGSHFDVPESIRKVDVKLSPPGKPLGAWYVGPSEDFTRPGSIWYSLGDQSVVPLYDQPSTAYHEGFPGHHLQTGIQMSLAGRLSRFHRMFVWYPGYGEGWGLYTELLMHELGYLEKPDYVLGYLAAEMLRACRIVIDIGAHLELPIPAGQPFHPGEAWTFEAAVEMLVEYATLSPSYARDEVTRYFGWPGQAISYKVGERTILDLRDELRRAQGSAFNLKEFHTRVLGSGPVGLDLLRELVLD